MTAETFQQITRMAAKEIQKDLDISLEASKQRQLGLVYQLLALAFLLGAADESLTRFYAMRLRFPHMMAGTELIKQTVYQTAAVFKQICVGWITDFGITAGGIHLQRSAVFVTILVRIFPRWLASVSLRQHQCQHIEKLLVKTLTNQYEQFRNKNRLLRKTGKAQQILHIGILPDYLDGLLVTKILDMFYDQCANYHAGWFVTCAVMRITKTLVVFLLYLVPGKVVCQLNPTV
jgi:hypothetical protein